jgi:hypothetical protein
MNVTVIIFCAFFVMCRAQLWADSLGVLYSAQTWKAVCSQHFSDADFTSPECLRLNRMVVSTFCATSSHSHSTPQPTEHTFATPPVSSSSPLVACPHYLHGQKPFKIYSRPLPSCPETN